MIFSGREVLVRLAFVYEGFWYSNERSVRKGSRGGDVFRRRRRGRRRRGRGKEKGKDEEESRAG